MRNTENSIEFLVGDTFCTASFTHKKFINKIKKLYGRYEKDFCYCIENKDGSFTAKFPLSWLKITPPTKKELTEEQKEDLRQRLAEIRNR